MRLPATVTAVYFFMMAWAEYFLYINHVAGKYCFLQNKKVFRIFHSFLETLDIFSFDKYYRYIFYEFSVAILKYGSYRLQGGYDVEK